MIRILRDVMQLVGQLPEKDQRYIAEEIMRMVKGEPSLVERLLHRQSGTWMRPFGYVGKTAKNSGRH